MEMVKSQFWALPQQCLTVWKKPTQASGRTASVLNGPQTKYLQNTSHMCYKLIHSIKYWSN